MLAQLISDFINYAEQVNFKAKSREAVTLRLNQLADYCESHNIQDINKITFQHLLRFVAEFGYCSVHVKKSKIWALHQFFHFLTLKKVIPENIALQLPYPRVGKKDPLFLTTDEFNRILQHFTKKVNKPAGLRNLIIIMLLGIIGLRLSSIVCMDVDDIDLENKTIRILEKGTDYKRVLPLPDVLISFLTVFINDKPAQSQSTGDELAEPTWDEPVESPLFLSRRDKRISRSTIQQLFRNVADELKINKKLHPHLFRHTAATYLNKTVGTSITQFVLGHARRSNTETYTHLNPDVYAQYMQRHPYMNINFGESPCKNSSSHSNNN
ncbi:MAG: tyrosine-type recombinase/integrase [Gammaproteobacteria bacterium]|nr:tyrosine-type recombinase/integrase [Gammaproteobacteria bacterium]